MCCLLTASLVGNGWLFQGAYYVHCCCCLVAKPYLTFFWLHGLQPTRLLCPWDSSGKNTGVVCHFILQKIFWTQGLNSGLQHWQADSSPLSHVKSLRECIKILQQEGKLTKQLCYPVLFLPTLSHFDQIKPRTLCLPLRTFTMITRNQLHW